MGFLCGRTEDAFRMMLNISNSLEMCGEQGPGGGEPSHLLSSWISLKRKQTPFHPLFLESPLFSHPNLNPCQRKKNLGL